jgi:hypothetical protein
MVTEGSPPAEAPLQPVDALSAPDASVNGTTEAPEAAAPPDFEAQAKDYQAQLEEARTALTKVENDAKSLKGRQPDLAPLLGRLDALSDRMETQFAATMAMGKSMAAQDEELGTGLDKIETQAATVSDTTLFDRYHTSMLNDLQKAVLDVDGSPLLDIEQAQELEPLREAWLAARREQDRDALAAAYNLVHPIVRGIERQQAEEKATLAQKTVQEEAAKKLQDAGVEDLDAGAGAASASSQSDADFTDQFGKGNLPATPENMARASRLQGGPAIAGQRY